MLPLSLRRALLIALLAAACAAWLAPSAAAEGPCSATVSITTAERVAEVNSLFPVNVEFNATLSVVQPEAINFRIFLSAAASTGWFVAVIPSVVTGAAAQANETLQVIVAVPKGANATDIGAITITPRGDYIPPGCEMVEGGAVVTPRPYWGPWKLAVEGDPSFNYGPGLIRRNFTLTSEANIRIADRALLRFEAPFGMEVDGPDFVDLPHPRDGVISARFEVSFQSRALQPGNYEVHVYAFAEGRPDTDLSAASATTVHKLYVRERGLHSAVVGAIALAGVASVVVAGWLWRRSRRSPDVQAPPARPAPPRRPS